MGKLRELRWDTGPVVPAELRARLSAKELSFFGDYSGLVGELSESYGFDLTSDAVPPKNLHIEVRVLEDCGEIFTTDAGAVRLERGNTYFVYRSDVEHLIRQGKLEHL